MARMGEQSWLLARKEAGASPEELVASFLERFSLSHGLCFCVRALVRQCGHNTGTRAILSKPTGVISRMRTTAAGQFVQSKVGVTKHVIKFDDTGEEEEVELARENNGKSPFRVATNSTIVQA